LSNVDIACVPTSGANPTGSIGLLVVSQEGTSAETIAVHGCYTGIKWDWVSGNAVASDGGPFKRFYISDDGLSSDANYTCFDIESTAGTWLASFRITDFSCGNGGQATVASPHLMLINGRGITLENGHFEALTTTGNVGIIVGNNKYSRQITLNNITCSTGMGDCIQLPASLGSDSITIMAAANSFGGNVLNDTQTNGCVVPGSDGYLGFYARSSNPNTSNNILTNASSCRSYLYQPAITNMPTSCSGQPTGTLWNSSGTVHVC
jgi:hypothetical protein